MALNTNYTRLTYQEILEDFQNRLKNDPRFSKLSSAAIFGMFTEMLAGTIDMTNFFMQRTAEEGFIDTAKLDSSIIKHGKTLGYNPKRSVPAQAEIVLTLKGPLPAGLGAGATVYFSQKDTNFSFNNKKYILSTDYSYTFDKDDIEAGQSSTWSKQIVLSKKSSDMNYIELAGTKEYRTSATEPIMIYQGEFKTVNFDGSDNSRKLGKNYQYYDINDITFSDWYGKRDPFAYKNGIYKKTKGYTKVGIGKTEAEAFKSENLFDIEDYSIYINDKVLEATNPDEPLNVCQIVSNQDKTMRLQFGDGFIVKCGLKTSDEKIYVQYLSTEGAVANAVGTTGSVLNTSSRFFATQQGAVVDVTSNIQFVLNSNIYGGADFEEQQSIKNNAPKYYASGDRLVTKPDFISWLNRLTTPINVKNAVVMGQGEVEDHDYIIGEGNAQEKPYQYLPLLQNIILYYISTSPYVINGKENTFKNPFVDDPSIKEPLTIYSNSENYLSHLADYAKLISNFEDVYANQYNEATNGDTFKKNIKLIRDAAEPKMMMNSKLIAMPPIFHLYDVYGTVEVESLSEIQKYKLEVENDVYKWLAENTSFNSPIYKSDIIKIYNQKEGTKYADLDIKVSSLVYVNDDSATIVKNNDISVIITKESNDLNIVTLNIPKSLTTSGTNNIPVSVQLFEDKLVGFDIKVNTDIIKINKAPTEISESSDYVAVIFDVYENINSNSAELNSNITIMPNSLYNAGTEQEKISEEFTGIVTEGKPRVDIELKNIPEDHINEKADKNYPKTVRLDQLIRKIAGTNGFSEKKFWNIIANNNLYDDPNLVSWYKFYKPAMSDNVLDNNNNIVNYSMACEMPIIRLNVTYKYRS